MLCVASVGRSDKLIRSVIEVHVAHRSTELALEQGLQLTVLIRLPLQVEKYVPEYLVMPAGED